MSRREKFGQRVRREMREREKQLHRGSIEQLRGKARDVGQRRERALKTASGACAVRKKRTASSSAAEYERAKFAARAERDAKRKAARAKCKADRAKVRAAAKKRQAEIRREERQAQKERRELARLEARANKKAASKATARERRQESDGEVLANVGPQYHALFRRVRGQIKGSDRWSRTEAFEHYIQEHPDEVHAAMSRDIDREMARQQRAQGPGPRSIRPPRRPLAVGEVPF